MKSKPSLIYVQETKEIVPFEERASDLRIKSSNILADLIKRGAASEPSLIKRV